MGSEPVEELPDDLEAWVSEQAAAADTTRAEVVRRLMAAHRLVDEQPDRFDGDGAALPEEAPVSQPEIDDIEARLADLSDRVGGLEADLDDKISDVRERVIQVKRETDAKAPKGHEHPELADRMEAGFANYKDVLEYLTDRTDDLETEAADRGEKLRRVANTVVDLRKRVAAMERVTETRAAAAGLRESANRQGISEAACGSCGESVRIGLLDEPVCPHCESSFDAVEPGGWFRSDRLTVGDRPALEAGTAGRGGTAPRSDVGSGPESDEPSDSAADAGDETATDRRATGEDHADTDTGGTADDRDTETASGPTADAGPDPDTTDSAAADGSGGDGPPGSDPPLDPDRDIADIAPDDPSDSEADDA